MRGCQSALGLAARSNLLRIELGEADIDSFDVAHSDAWVRDTVASGGGGGGGGGWW